MQLYRESLPTFETATLEDVLSAARLHTGKKAVNSFSSPDFGLIGTFWHETLGWIIILVGRRCQLEMPGGYLGWFFDPAAEGYYNDAGLELRGDAR